MMQEPAGDTPGLFQFHVLRLTSALRDLMSTHVLYELKSTPQSDHRLRILDFDWLASQPLATNRSGRHYADCSVHEVRVFAY